LAKKQNRTAEQWRVLDCHIHTPASADFQQPEATYLDILQRAEARGLNIIAITDHNTVAGYRKMREKIEQLEMLEKLNRILPEERSQLNEYRRLNEKMLVLPGIEFTATFGFHIIGIFPPEKPVREIEHLLLSLNIPPNQVDDGSATVGATSDVLTAYRLINQAGGLVIAAHANSSNGVAMRGFTFGGQTKIAYTQDPNLHALEVTDLEQQGSRSTAAFFNGTKPEYPRRMHCIQGSDAHRLTTDPGRKKNPGIGDKPTDVLLPELSFVALRNLFTGNDFSRTRPHRHTEEPVYDFIQTALDEGPNIIQDFHESLTVRGGKLYAIIADVCAFLNTNGGSLYIGLSSESQKPTAGIQEPENALRSLETEINNRITPTPSCSLDIHSFKGKQIIRVLVPRGDDPPYAVEDNRIYLRSEAETGLAVRDEIVNLVLRGRSLAQAVPVPASAITPKTQEAAAGKPESLPEPVSIDDITPRTGVEVLPGREREGDRFYSMRDLRNGNVVKNVTRSSARRLWHYAISQYLDIADKINQIPVQWQGDYGVIKRYKQEQRTRFDLIQRTPSGYRFFFGVTQDGIHGPWKYLTGEEDA
jgi:PHP family Zn ribbon phosphoesterase